MSRICRLLLDPPASGAWNMAVDEALLNSAVQRGQPTLRFYGWSEPTLSLGYFQKYDQRCQHQASLGCPVVRRLTGGGAILHDQEFTYSLAWFQPGHGRPDVRWLYKAMHEAIAAALQEKSRAAHPFKGPEQDESFLCFQRRSPYDLVSGDAKVVGSAQRRRKNAVLQHGSILLATSAFAPEVCGLNDVTGQKDPKKTVDYGELQKVLPPLIESRLQLKLIVGPLTERETREAGQLAKEKYDSGSWICRR